MKQILGDNQFFGVNHNDIDKGDKTKILFSNNDTIVSFINDSFDIGLSGCMINSNNRGYEIVNEISSAFKGEIHYSVPYPHKFASMVNERGMLMLLNYVFSKSSLTSLFLHLPKFLLSGNIKYTLPLILDLEIPKKLPKGSYVYLQNIVTDLIIGMKRYDLIESFCEALVKKGFYPGLITLNPVLLDKVVASFPLDIQKQLVICFNININGFNVFPSLDKVENFVRIDAHYKKMGMSILSSGGVNNIVDSLNYIKTLPLDYVVYGSSNLKNVESNYNILK